MTIRVLLADDHAVLRDGLSHLIGSDKGMAVVGQVANGLEAVRLAKETKPDIVLMDVSMPEMNGIEATTRILECCPETRVLILSMHSAGESIRRALTAGARGYLLKEAAGREVLKAINRVQEGEIFLSDRISHDLIRDYVQGLKEGQWPKEPLDVLSAREREVLQLVAEGNSSADIADKLCLSPKTIESYRSRIMQKIGVSGVPGLVKFAIRNGLTPL